MRSRGFTLLEIVVSMIILSIVVAGAYGLFVSNYKLLTDAKHRLQAVNQAATVMEKLKSYVSADPNLPANAGEWGALKTGTNYSPQTQIGLDAVPFITGVSNPQWKYSVENVTGTDIKKVTVIVNWDEV